MGKPKSFIKDLFVDVAKRKHYCQHSKHHTILMGDTRLGLRDHRSTEYYCRDCATKFLENGIQNLMQLANELQK